MPDQPLVVGIVPNIDIWAVHNHWFFDHLLLIGSPL